MELGDLDVWSGELRAIEPAQAQHTAARVEELGFGTLWVPGGAGGPVLDLVSRLLDGTTPLIVATES